MKTKFINQPFSKRAVMVLAVLLTALTAGATEFITEVKLIGTQGKSNIDKLISDYKADGWTLVNKDLNAGCGSGSDFIYLLYKSAENTDGVNHGYITDFYIYGSSSKGFDEEVSFEGRKYKLVTYAGGEKFKESMGDLNRAAGGDFIHLYYTMDPMDDEAVSDIAFNDTKSGAVGNQGGSTGYDLNAGCGKGTDYIYMHLTKDEAKTLTSVDYVSYSYNTTNGLKSEIKTCNDFKLVESDDCYWCSGWYVISGNVAINNRIYVEGTANLILRDGCKLEANMGIEVAEGNTLNIFAQSSDGAKAGSLVVEGDGSFSAIGGGSHGAGGTVTIYGGTLEAIGGSGGGSGIGGGYGGSGGTVTIYGGTVEAIGGMAGGSGIGGGVGGAGGNVSIFGGTVEAYGQILAAGIGCGDGGDAQGTLKIGNGLNVYGGNSANPTTLIATGPQDNVESRTISMIVGEKSPVSYLKYSFDEKNQTLTRERRYCADYTIVTETTKDWSSGWYVVSGNVEISDHITVSGTVNLILCDGCTLEAKNGIVVGENYTLNIFAQSEGVKTGRLKASGFGNFAGIGGYGNDIGGTLTVYGGSVEAHGGSEGAGIGGGYKGAGGTVTIYSGTVEAHGGIEAAGIGGGYKGAGGTVTIYGGMVKANGGDNGEDNGEGIGAGCSEDRNGTLKIGDGIKVYGGDSENPTTLIATGPKDNVGKRYRYIIVGGNIKGDANDDFRVNAADIVEMVNAMNGNASDKFVLKYADIDGSGNITQSDIDAVVKIILKK